MANKVELGLLFPIGGIATGYTALILALAIWYFVPPGLGVYVTLIICVLYWSLVQFSFYAIALDADNEEILLSRKLWGIIEIGMRIKAEDIEFYYVRTANMSQTIRHASIGPNFFEEVDISSKTGLVEIKMKGKRKYDVIATGKMHKMKEIALTVFKPLGIKFHKQVPPKPKNRRR